MLRKTFATVFLLSSAWTTTAVAQYAATFAYPRDGQRNVPLAPDLAVTTTLPIDPASVSWAQDTAPERLANPTVLIVPQSVYDAYDSSEWHANCPAGSYRIAHDSILVFTPRRLMPGTGYVAVARNLRVLDAHGAPHAVGLATARFVTVGPAVEFRACDLAMHPEIYPFDTITVRFTGKLPDVFERNGRVASAAGDVVDFGVVTGSVDDPDSMLTRSATAPVAFESWLDADSTAISCRLLAVPYDPMPESVRYGSYELRVHASRVNGDAASDRTLPFHFHRGCTLDVSLLKSGGGFLPEECRIHPASGSTSYAFDDTVRIAVAPEWHGYAFAHWDCPRLPSVHGGTSPDLSFVLHAGDALGPFVEMFAVYDPPTDSVRIAAGANGSVVVADAARDTTYGGAATYAQVGDRSLLVVAVPASGHHFLRWVSDDSAIAATTTFVTAVDRLAPIDSIRALFAPNDTNDRRYRLTARIVAADGTRFRDRCVTDPPGGSTHTDAAPAAYTLSATIVAPDSTSYRFTKYVTPDGAIHALPAPADSVGGTFTTVNPPSDVVFFAVRQNLELRVAVDLDTHSSNAKYVGVRVEVAMNGSGPDTAWTTVTGTPQTGYRSYAVSPDAGMIRLSAIDDPARGLVFDHWEANAPYIGPGRPAEARNYVNPYGLSSPVLTLARFTERFQLVEICLTVVDSATQTMSVRCFPAYPWAPVIDSGGGFAHELACAETVPNPNAHSPRQVRTTKIRFRFSHEVDRNTLYCNGPCGRRANLFVRDNSVRIDQYYIYEWAFGFSSERSDLRFLYLPDDRFPDNNVTFTEANHAVEFTTVTDPANASAGYSAYLPRFMNFQMMLVGGDCGLKSAEGYPLWTGVSTDSIPFDAHTERGVLRHELNRMYVHDNHEDALTRGNPELYHLMAQTVGAYDQATAAYRILRSDSAKYPPGGATSHWIDDDDSCTVDYELPPLGKMRPEWGTRVGILTLEDDSSPFLTAVGNALEGLKDLDSTVIPIASNLYGAILDVVIAIAKAFDLNYDVVGGGEIWYDLGSWWGAHPSTQRQHRKVGWGDMRYIIDSYLE